MAIRIHRANDGYLVALCAAKSDEKEGDIYLDDEAHYALSRKFWRDYEEINIVDEEDIERALLHEKLD